MVAPLGEPELAATTMGALNAFALIILPVGVVFIVQSFTAQLRGRGELGAVPRYAWYGLAVALVAGILAAALIPVAPVAIGWLGLAPDVEQLMTTYIAIRLLSVAPAVGVEALGNWFGGLGRTRPALVAGVVTMVTNVLGNWLLIRGRAGFPALGVTGAAWASVSASFVGFGVLAWLFLREQARERIAALFTLRRRELLRVLRFGLPNGVNWFLEFVAFVLFINVVIGHLGTTTLAAFNVVMQLNSLAFMPAIGVASGGAILVGEAIGRRAHEQVWPIVKLAGGVNVIWMVSIGVCYIALPEPLIGLFRPRDLPAETLMAVGATMLALSGLWQLFDALGITLSETLRAAGDTTWCMGARIVLAWVVFTPLSWSAVLVFGGGVLTVMSCLIAYLVVLALAFGWRFASGSWREIDLVGREPEVV